MTEVQAEMSSEQFGTHKSGGVVVPGRLGVAESLKDGVGLHDLVLQRDLGVEGEEGCKNHTSLF